MLAHNFLSKEYQIIISTNSNHVILNMRHNPIRETKSSLNCESTGTSNFIFPQREYRNSDVRILCTSKLKFTMQPPKTCSNTHAINECIEIFHKARNIDKVRHWMKLHTALREMKITMMVFSTVIECIKKLDACSSVESIKIKSDNRFVLRRGKKRLIDVSKATALMNEKVHNHAAVMTNPADDAELVPNLSRPHGDLCKSTISNYANLPIANDDKIMLSNISSARLKSLGRIIGSESERALCACMSITIACQFCAGKWASNPNNLLRTAERFVICLVQCHA